MLHVVACKERGVAEAYLWVSKSSSHLHLSTGVNPIRLREGAVQPPGPSTSQGQHQHHCFVLCAEVLLSQVKIALEVHWRKWYLHSGIACVAVDSRPTITRHLMNVFTLPNEDH